MSLPTPDRAAILRALEATAWVIEGAAGAALILRLHPHTLRYRMKVLGIERRQAPARAEAHPPAAALTVELAKLRRHAVMLRANYLPTPARSAMLRENELAQRAILVQLRGTLGDRPVFGGVRGAQAPGALRPAWAQRW
jgi:hypothetical protein